jgi:hypothetical protein
MNPRIKAALIRAARTAAQAFAATIGQRWLAGHEQTISALIRTVQHQADAAGGVAVLAAAAALGLNWARPVSPEAAK